MTCVADPARQYSNASEVLVGYVSFRDISKCSIFLNYFVAVILELQNSTISINSGKSLIYSPLLCRRPDSVGETMQKTFYFNTEH